MAVKSRQIGWDDEQILEYYVSKQLDRLAKIRCCTSSITTTSNEGNNLLLEDGGDFLLEGGGNILLE